MASFTSFRIAKGVRISTSSRGLRAHVGPRAARLHIGGGGSGISTGTGPVTYYTSLGGKRRSTSRARSTGPSNAQLAQAEKEQEFLRLRELFQAILDIHRVEFPKSERPIAPPPEPVDEASLHKTRKKEQLRGVAFWKLSERKAAKARAKELAAADVTQQRTRRAEQRAARQRDLDEAWARLVSNDQATVMATIDQAFEDNQAPAAPVNVEGSTLSLVMLAPGDELVPANKPAVTPSGKATVKKLTKTEAADAYLTLICGHLLATIKEALSVAPSIAEVKAVVVRRTEPDVYGERHLEALLTANYARSDLGRVQWASASSPQIVQDIATERKWKLKGKPPALQALDLEEEPDLKLFIAALEAELPASA